MIELKNITKAFKEDISLSQKYILDNISIKLELGKIYGLFGKNGSGKTSVLKVITKLMKPELGNLHFDKVENSYKEIAFSSEKVSFFPDLKCKEFFFTIKDIYNIPKPLFEERLNYFCKIFEIENFLDRKIKYFSQGMLKKVSFISCILNQPKFILLDEPFSGLDFDSRIVLKNEIENFRSCGGGVLLTSHMFDDVSNLIDEWFYIKKGKILDTSIEKSWEDDNYFEGYHIEVTDPSGNVHFSKKEASKNLNKYIFKVLKSEKNKFIKEIISKDCNIESIVLNKLKLGEYFLTLEDRKNS